MTYFNNVYGFIPTNAGHTPASEDDPTIIILLEGIFSEFMVYEILSFIDTDASSVYGDLLTINWKIPNEHRHSLSIMMNYMKRITPYDHTKTYRIVCSINELRRIAILRKLIPLLFSKLEHLTPDENGLTCFVAKSYFSHICSNGIYIRDWKKKINYRLVTNDKCKMMSSIHQSNVVIAFLLEQITYNWLSVLTMYAPPINYFQFIGAYRVPDHSECILFQCENEIR